MGRVYFFGGIPFRPAASTGRPSRAPLIIGVSDRGFTGALDEPLCSVKKGNQKDFELTEASFFFCFYRVDTASDVYQSWLRRFW